MTNPKDDERFNETLRRLLETPPKPHKDEPKRRASKQKRPGEKEGRQPKPPPKE